MICLGCGRTLEETARFCPGCGRRTMFDSGGFPVLDRLVRPREGRMIAGVCMGLAQRYGWDVALVRLVAVLALIFAGTPFVVYLVAWVVIPNGQFFLPAQTGARPGSMTV